MLRTNAGFEAFSFIGGFARIFLDYVSAGCEFVFGSVTEHYVAFKVRFFLVVISLKAYYLFLRLQVQTCEVPCP